MSEGTHSAAFLLVLLWNRQKKALENPENPVPVGSPFGTAKKRVPSITLLSTPPPNLFDQAKLQPQGQSDCGRGLKHEAG